MNQESRESQAKPVLNAKDFQCLLAAAYLLQTHSERGHDNAVLAQPTVAERTKAFAAGGIVQRRTPRLSAKLQVTPSTAEIPVASQIVEEKPAGRRMLLVGHRALPPIGAFVSRALSWRGIEALAVSAIFLALVGVSIHGLWGSRRPVALASEVSPPQDSARTPKPAAEALASTPQPVPPFSRQAHDGEDADIVAEDTVVRYPTRAVDLSAQEARKPRNAGMLAADTVVHYGSDVKMWSGNPRRGGLQSLGR